MPSTVSVLRVLALRWRGIDRGRRRATGAVLAVVLLSTLAAIPAQATTAESGLAWPADDYSVFLEGGETTTIAPESGSAAAVLRLAGSFDITVGEAPDSAAVTYRYVGSGASVTLGGVTGEGELFLTITGISRSADGRMAITREEASAVFSDVSIAGFPGITLLPVVTKLDDTLPLSARWRGCGIIEGTWSGSLAGLGVAVAAYPQATLDQFLEARFLALSSRLGPRTTARLVEALRDDAVDLRTIESDLILGALERSEAVVAASRAVAAAEAIVGELTHPECPALTQFSLGVSAPLASLLMTIVDAPGELAPTDVALLVESAVRSGLTSSEGELTVRLADLLVEVGETTERGDAAAITPLILSAVALGDLSLADDLAGRL